MRKIAKEFIDNGYDRELEFLNINNIHYMYLKVQNYILMLLIL